MNHQTDSVEQTDEVLLTFDVSDEALEDAGGVERGGRAPLRLTTVWLNICSC